MMFFRNKILLRNIKVLLLLAVSLSCLPKAVHAAATTKMEGERIVMENEQLRIAIDPKIGGRVVEYIFKPWGNTNLAFPAESNGGMLMDMFWQHGWPGELLKNPYQYEIVKTEPDEAVVKVWRVSTGEANGVMVEDVAGIRVQRTIRLRSGDRALRVQVSLQNTVNKGRLVGYWMQNNFFLLGRKEANTWYRPTIQGVDRISVEKPSPYYWFYVEAPQAGWIGVANSELHGGLMLLMDYNDLWKLYTNMGAITTEWMYDRVAIPPGKAWETEVAIVPTPGLDSYAFGSRPLIAELDIESGTDGVKVTHKLTSGTTELRDVTLRTWAESARGDWKSKPVEQHLDKVDTSAATFTTQLPDAKTPPLVVKVEVKGMTTQGESVTLNYGDYYGGSAGKNIDLVTLAPLYSFPRPAKKKVFLKPDKIVKAKNDHLRVLFVRGLWHEYSGVDEALKQIPGAEVVDSWYTQSDVGFSLLNFPSDYDAILGYDVVVLANIDAPALGLVGQEMLADFVEAGGGLLFVGGDRTYGEAAFDNERFTKLLPVTLNGAFDWHKLPRPAALSGVNPDLTRGVTFGTKTVTLYRHALQPEAGATVAVRAGNAPVLVTKKSGQGKVAASLLLPFGEPTKGQTGYWQSPQWFETMRNTLEWLAKK